MIYTAWQHGHCSKKDRWKEGGEGEERRGGGVRGGGGGEGLAGVAEGKRGRGVRVRRVGGGAVIKKGEMRRTGSVGKEERQKEGS